MKPLEINRDFVMNSSYDIEKYINETLVPAITVIESMVDYFREQDVEHRNYIIKLEQRIEALEQAYKELDIRLINEKSLADKIFDAGKRQFQPCDAKPVECEHEWERRDDYFQYCKKCDVMRHSLEQDNTLAEKFANYQRINKTIAQWSKDFEDMAREHFEKEEAYIFGKGVRHTENQIKLKMQEFYKGIFGEDK